ncbi:DUF1802 family protein [Paenibacillus hodogayensis]|uniref:DUF1802 family protein n=1 Tax=Paenibacillus hodogayensis TaxID=279208 RepID=A0ABV5W8D0_9BACL
MSIEPIALKEWAAAIRALSEGRQTVLLRKGGIVEETREFRLESPSFWLYPTYEHQKRELFKEEEKFLLDESLLGWSPEMTHAGITCYAEVAADIEVTSQEQLDRIRDFHVWTDEFAEERLRWKRQKPLHVLILRVYKLDDPASVRILDAYSGCKSWIRIEDELPDGARTPVLDDEEFERISGNIRHLLTF